MCGDLERQSGTRFALPARHRKSMSCYYSLKVKVAATKQPREV